MDEDEPLDIKEKGKQVREEKGNLKGEGKGKKTIEDNGTWNEEKEEYESEGDDLWAPDSDDEVANKFITFIGEDMHTPKFHTSRKTLIGEMVTCGTPAFDAPLVIYP